MSLKGMSSIGRFMACLSSTDNDVLRVHASGNLAHELCPVDTSCIADDIDARQAASLDQVVACPRRLEPAHQADFVAQLAADADTVVVKLIEELQHAGLQRSGHAATSAPDARD